MSRPWTLSDAWVFAALAGTGPGAGRDLTGIVAAADAINHAIPTEAEFAGAVGRLLAAGLVGAEPEADRYWHTEAGRALYERRMRRRGLSGWVEAIPPALERLGAPGGEAWSPPPDAFDRAVRAYLRR